MAVSLEGLLRISAGHADLADVVDESGRMEPVQPVGGEPHLDADGPGQVGHPLLVAGGVGVAHLDDHGHGLDGGVERPAQLLEALSTLLHPMLHLLETDVGLLELAGGHQVADAGVELADVDRLGQVVVGPVLRDPSAWLPAPAWP